MDSHLGIRIAPKLAARLLVNELAEAIEEAALLVLNPLSQQLLAQPQGRELAHRMGQQGDAHPQLFDFGDTLENPAGDAALMQMQSQAEAGNAATNDRNFHRRRAPSSDF